MRATAAAAAAATAAAVCLALLPATAAAAASARATTTPGAAAATAAAALSASEAPTAGPPTSGSPAATASHQPPTSVKLRDVPDPVLNAKQEKQGGLDGRGSSWQKRWYRMIPMLLVPGLLMAAVLPFVLPALKMLTMAALMINNMAFTGALFTLLRNNAFRDNYDHKVVYVNEGYRDEEGVGSEGLGRRGVVTTTRGRGRRRGQGGRGKRGRPQAHQLVDAPDPHYEAFVEFEPPAQWWHDDAPAAAAAHEPTALASAPAPAPASAPGPPSASSAAPPGPGPTA